MKKLVILLSISLFGLSANAQKWALDKSHAKLAFTITHLGISEVDGVFKTFDATIDATKQDFSDAKFTLTADAKTLTTFMDMRDGHLQGDGWFDTAKFPTVTFASTKTEALGNKKFKVSGNLTMHGVTKPVTLDMTLIGTTTDKRSGKALVGFKAVGNLNRVDFGVGKSGGSVSDEVELRASGEFVQQ